MALPQYEAMRRRTQQQNIAQSQMDDDAMKRRFAAQGRIGSGAYIKQAQIAADQQAQRQGSQFMDIDAAEAQELQRQKEVGEGRQFQTSEREASQRYGSGEREASQKYGTSERMGSQGFTAEQAAMARAIQQEQFNKQFGSQEEQRKYENSQNEKIAKINAAMAAAGIEDDDQRNSVYRELAKMGYVDLAQLYGWNGPEKPNKDAQIVAGLLGGGSIGGFIGSRLPKIL